MIKKNIKQGNIWYGHVNATNDGSILSNKSFHIVYSILKHDFQTHSKKIIGILYNDFDKSQQYFQLNVPLSVAFDIEYLLKYVIYTKEYNKHFSKKVLLENADHKKVLDQALNQLKSKVPL